MNKLSLESFYGGKQGVSPVIKARFKYVDTQDEDFLALTSSQQTTALDNNEVMEAAFSKSDYQRVWYGELAIIDTDNKQNPTNGRIYRRTYYQDNISDKDTLHGEYIGQIVGPKGDSPNFKAGSIKNLKEYLKTYRTNLQKVNYSYSNQEASSSANLDLTNKNDESIFSNIVETEIQPLTSFPISGVVYDDNENIIDYETGIKYCWVDIKRRGDNGAEPISEVFLGFDIPYTVFDFNFKETSWRNPIQSNLNNKEEFKEGSQPFYQNWDIFIPTGVPGISIKNIRREKAENFSINSLYNFSDINNCIDNNGLWDNSISLNSTIDSNLFNTPTTIIVATLKIPYKTNENSGFKEYDCLIGTIKDIHSIAFNEQGQLCVNYTDNPSVQIPLFQQPIKWITNISMSSSNNTNLKDQLSIQYNNANTQTFIIPHIAQIQAIKNNNKYTFTQWIKDNEKQIAVPVTLSTNTNRNFEISMIDGVKIDEDTKQLQFHTNPEQAILNPSGTYQATNVFLNAIEDTFIHKDGHLYILYSSSNFRLKDEDINDETDIWQDFINQYSYCQINNKRWCKGESFPDSEKWWLDLGLVKVISKGVKIASQFDEKRYEAFRILSEDTSFKDIDECDSLDILKILNRTWEFATIDYNPYITGKINIYSSDIMAWNNQEYFSYLENAVLKDTRIGEFLFYKGHAYYYDETTSQWVYGGGWEQQEQKAQWNVLTPENQYWIPNEDFDALVGFYFITNSKEKKISSNSFLSNFIY